MDFHVRCGRCPGGFADRHISRTGGNPDRPFWRCPGNCKFFVWEDDLTDFQKVYPEPCPGIDSTPSTPGSSQHRRGMMAYAPTDPQPTPSKKRPLSPHPLPYQELEPQGTSPSPSSYPAYSHPTRSQDSAKAMGLEEINKPLSQLQNESANCSFYQPDDSCVAKAPRLENAPDVHSGSQSTVPDYTTPPPTLPRNVANYSQPPVTPETPTRKGQEKTLGNSNDSTSLPSQEMLSGSQPVPLQLPSFEKSLAQLRSAYQLSERRRQAAERSADAKKQRIKFLESQVISLGERLKKIQNAMKI